MSHPNICKLYEVYESPSDVYLVLECAQGGELFDRIKDAGAFSEKQASTILRQMCEGLKYMHENKIVSDGTDLGQLGGEAPAAEQR